MIKGIRLNMEKICNTLVDLGILLPADDLTMDTTIEEETLSYSPSSSPSRHSMGSVSESDSIEYLEETAEATPMKKGSCARISKEEYEKQGREYTQKMLVQLVDQMKKDQAKLGKRALRSKAKTFNEIIKTSIWSMFSKDEYNSNEMSEQDKVKAVEELADKIMKTHYYYNGDVEQKPVNNMEVKQDAGFVAATSDNNNVKDHQNKSVDSPLCHKKRALFASIKKRKGLNDITNSNEKSKKKLRRRRRKSIKHNVSGGSLLSNSRPFNPFLAEIENVAGKSKLRKASTKPKGQFLTKPMTLLDEIKLVQKKRLKTIGKKSPGGTPLKKRKPRKENTMRSALENALLKRFKNIRRDSDSPLASSPCGRDF